MCTTQRAGEVIGQRVHAQAGRRCLDPVWSGRRIVSGTEVGQVVRSTQTSGLLRRNVFVRLTSPRCRPRRTQQQASQHRKHIKQPFGPLRLLIGFRELCSMTDLPEPEPSDCSLLHNVQMSNKTTKNPARPHYQYRTTTNHCPLHPFQAKILLNLRFSVFLCSSAKHL